MRRQIVDLVCSIGLESRFQDSRLEGLKASGTEGAEVEALPRVQVD